MYEQALSLAINSFLFFSFGICSYELHRDGTYAAYYTVLSLLGVLAGSFITSLLISSTVLPRTYGCILQTMFTLLSSVISDIHMVKPLYHCIVNYSPFCS